jgi:hypothetical protein
VSQKRLLGKIALELGRSSSWARSALEADSISFAALGAFKSEEVDLGQSRAFLRETVLCVQPVVRAELVEEKDKWAEAEPQVYQETGGGVGVVAQW